MRIQSRLVLVVAIAAACSPPADSGASTADGSGSTSFTTLFPTSGPGTEGSGGMSAGSGGAIKFDVGAPEETGTGGADQGCKRVDVLLSIDNSGSMVEELAALSGPVFDAFPQALLDVGNGLDDFQLAVIDACNDPANLHDTGAGGACNFSTGANYMSSTSPALIDEYHCVTALTQSGWMGMADACSGDNDDEQPANTAADAVSPPAVSGANAGFVRDDAVLFVVAITDEDEQPAPDASAQEIADKLIAAKGTVNNVVFLGIGGGSDCEGPYGGANDAVRLREVAELFAAEGRGLFWDLCQGDLEQAFQAGLGVVDSACIDFEPPG
jgi:hypothetical protein